MDLQELLGREVDLVVEGSHQNSGLCVIRLKKTSSLSNGVMRSGTHGMKSERTSCIVNG